MAGFITSLKEKLTKTRQGFTEKIDSFFARFTKVDEDLLEELEEVLIQSDIGAQTSFELVEDLRQVIKERRITDPAALTGTLQELIEGYLGARQDLIMNADLTVYLVVGVNGVGKTTTIGKMAHFFTQQKKKVILTFCG